MANETVSLYIDDNSLRLMVTKGRQITEWAESPLEPGLIEDNVVIQEAIVAARIKQLFKTQNIKTRKINLGLSGSHCFSRPISFPKLPKEMLDEAVRREAIRVWPVPLEELYLSWQTIPAPATQTQVFMVGIPRKIADALFRTLHYAGLKAGFMQIKPLLLTRAVKEARAIIIDVQAMEFDIVVMADGVLHPVRSIRFASRGLSGEEKITIIRNELNRSLSFYNTTYPEKALAAEVPVFTSGDFANESELYRPLSAELGRPVLPLQPPLECPDGINPGHYMANISLAFQATSRGEKAGDKAATLNALPDAYQTKAVSLTNVLVLPSAAVAAILLFSLVTFNQNASADITTLKAGLKTTNQQLLQKQSQQKALSTKIAELQKKVDGAKTSRDRISQVLNIIEEQAEATDRDLAAAIESLPQSITLVNIRHISNVLTITGKSPDERQVSSYIAKLDKSGRFGNIVITDMTRNDFNEVDFTLVGTLQSQTIGAGSMEIALGSLPTGVSLTNVSSDEGSITLNGVAPNADKVFSYIRVLEASEKYSEITVSRMTKTEGATTIFALVLKTGG